MKYVECYCFNCVFETLGNARQYLGEQKQIKARDFLSEHMRKTLKEVRREESARSNDTGELFQPSTPW